MGAFLGIKCKGKNLLDEIRKVENMETLEINKTFKTHDEMEEYERKLAEEYIVVLTEIDGDTYTIKSITHFGKRK